MFNQNSSLNQLSKKLSKKGILKYPNIFIWFIRICQKSKKLQAGEYSINSLETPIDLASKLLKGNIVLYSFTIVPGWTFHQLIHALSLNTNISHHLQNLSDKKIMKLIGHPDETPEGLFYPDTYKIPSHFSDVEILKEAYLLMQNKLKDLWKKKDKKVPYNYPYQALIVASIIEKEATLKEEKLIISGVITNRLERHMRLQLDPTVIYGLGEKFNGDLTKKDLRKNTRYNTYLHFGLPPTPICMPSESSIYAALHPLSSSALYYVSKGDGSHEFSSSLEKQNLAVKKYQRKRKNG